jgi:DNA helicase-2/ATP-dependent DNA helicase PcrA
VEEERRLFYVGVTRAQTNLTLLRTVMRMRFGKTEISVPSRFLDEIPEMLLDTENKAGAGSGAHRGSNWNQYEKKESRWGEKSKRGGDFDDFDLDQDEAPKLGSKSAQSKFSVDADYSSQLDDGELTVGDRVSHAKFGEGVVESLSGLGLSRKATVRFRAFGVKQLLVSLAKLQKK